MENEGPSVIMSCLFSRPEPGQQNHQEASDFMLTPLKLPSGATGAEPEPPEPQVRTEVLQVLFFLNHHLSSNVNSRLVFLVKLQFVM